jgi:radical SAM superfamily enzyme YgiQ (UPF0313 family)
MKIALVFPPYNHKKFNENLRTVDEEFGIYPPLNLAYVAAILEKAGHEVILIDAKALKLSKKAALEKVKKFNPDLLGFMLTTYMFHQTLDWIRYLKQNTDLPVVVGGINVMNYPRETLSHQEIDYAIIGSAKKALPQLVDALEQGKDFTKIKGLCYKNNGEVNINQPDSLAEDIDELPFPARHLLPNHRYYSFISKRKNFTIMVTAKGCPYPCTFCAIGKIPYSERSPKKIADEIEECYEKYNVREIDFFTATFTLNKSKVMELCEEIKKRGLNIDWSCRSRCDTVNEKLLKEMASAGCKRIYYGIESGDPRILKAVKKNINLKQVEKAIKLTQKYGIKALGFFMIGNPGETRESVEKTVKFAKKLNLDFIQVMRTIPKPCTDLDEDLKRKTGKDYWRDFVLGKEEEKRLPNIWCDLSDKEIDHYMKKLYSLYFSPKYIIKTILGIKSFHELRRYIKAGLEMIFYEE